jgi:hypothetical protein
MTAELRPFSTVPVSPQNLPVRLALLTTAPDGSNREVVYVLRHTRQGKLVLNRDDFATDAPRSN